jgi:beta-phosphoglucomutase
LGEETLMLSIRRGAALWDMDGTLVDTAELHFAAWHRLCAELDRPFSRADFGATFGQRNPEIFRHLFGTVFSEAQIADLGNRKEEYYRAAARQGVQLLPGARELLATLHEGGIPQAIASSAPRANLDLILSLTHTTAFFNAIISMEDTTKGKPDPQVFLLAAEKLKVPPERCVVFEDAVAGVQAARAGGMHCVAVSFVGHHPAEKLQAAGADLVVKTLENVSLDQLDRLLHQSKR